MAGGNTGSVAPRPSGGAYRLRACDCCGPLSCLAHNCSRTGEIQSVQSASALQYTKAARLAFALTSAAWSSFQIHSGGGISAAVERPCLGRCVTHTPHFQCAPGTHAWGRCAPLPTLRRVGPRGSARPLGLRPCLSGPVWSGRLVKGRKATEREQGRPRRPCRSPIAAERVW